MKNTDNLLDSFLYQLKIEIDKYKRHGVKAPALDKRNCLSNFPVAKETMERLVYYSTIIKILGDTFNSMKVEEASSDRYKSYSEEEKTFIDIADSYRKGILSELGDNIEKKSVDCYINNFKKVCDIYTQGIYPLKKKVKDAHLLIKQIPRPMDNSNSGLENTDFETAYKNLEVAIANAENKLNAFSRVYSRSNLSGAMIEYGFSTTKDKDAAYFDKKLKEFLEAAALIDGLMKYIRKK